VAVAVAVGLGNGVSVLVAVAVGVQVGVTVEVAVSVGGKDVSVGGTDVLVGTGDSTISIVAGVELPVQADKTIRITMKNKRWNFLEYMLFILNLDPLFRIVIDPIFSINHSTSERSCRTRSEGFCAQVSNLEICEKGFVIATSRF
jgi:hypothetical protein